MGSINYAELAAKAEKGREPVPVGPYEVEVTGAEPKVAKSGNSMYKVEFTVENGPHKGTKFWRHITLVAHNPYYFFADMKNLGLDSKFFSELPDDDADAQATIAAALIGQHVVVKITHRDYKGQPQNEVDEICPTERAKSEAGVPDTESGGGSTPPGLPPGL